MRVVFALSTAAFLLCGVSTAFPQTTEETYLRRYAELSPDDTAGHYDLACWCDKNGLSDRAKELFNKVIEMDPNHAEARAKLGYVMYKNEWVTREEKEIRSNKDKGLAWYGTRWMPVKEMEAARSKERDSIKWPFDYKMETKHYVVFSTASEPATRRISAAAENTYQSFFDMFKGQLKLDVPRSPMQIRVYKTRAEYEAACASLEVDSGKGYGKYVSPKSDLPGMALVHEENANIEEVAHHECIHQLWRQCAGFRQESDSALWLSEGIAYYFQCCAVKNGKLVLNDLGSLGRIYLSGVVASPMKLRTLLCTSEYGQRLPENAWMLTHFLLHGRGGRYRTPFMKFLQESLKEKTGVADTAAFEKVIGNTATLEKELIEYAGKLQNPGAGDSSQQ
jgi:hypothetical protein